MSSETPETPPVEDGTEAGAEVVPLVTPSAGSRPAEEKATSEPADERVASEPAEEGDSAPDETRKDAEAPEDFDLQDPALYLNRELTWLEFDRRVLHEAEDPRVPLLERLKFLAIANSNIDEFIMKRIGGLKQQVGAGVYDRTVDGRTPREQIGESLEIVRQIDDRCRELLAELVQELEKVEIRIKRVGELEEDQQKSVRQYYHENIYPLVTPQAMDPAHPFPFVSNLSLNLLVTLRHPKDEHSSLARVKVPIGRGVPRFVSVDQSGTFVCLEDVVASNLDLLFPGMEIEGAELFRVTRNANAETDEDQADDLLAMIESELRERKFAPIVRLQIAPGMSDVHRGMLASELGLDDTADVVEVRGMLGMSDIMEIASLDRPELHDEPHRPVDVPELPKDVNIFHSIREHGSILLHHPYQSFSASVERFLEEAAEDPKVRAIKMTLYRTSEGTGVIDALVDAARNGKQVAVVVELKARFDESANIRWASRLENAGIHVTYGVVGLKTHSKVILVLRQDYNGLRRYAHVGTGNYHAGTARLYSDLGLLTCDKQIGEDLTELFNYLTTGYKPKRKYQKILPAPTVLKSALLEKIQREIDHVREGRDGHIILKMNALEDADTTRALYEASKAGVHVQLIVRDTCRLRPGIPGLSDNAEVVSIVGRFLEHARILYFRNDEAPEFYIGSADWMKRNLESRVECMTPVESPALQRELMHILEEQLADERGAWEMLSDGTYVQRMGDPERSAQTRLQKHAEKRLKRVRKLRKRKPRTGPKRGR